MNTYPDLIKHNLLSIISEMAKSRHLFVKNPDTDFSRNRKLPFESVFLFLISMGGNTIRNEMLESFGFSLDTATSSAFIQQRDKINTSAFEFLFHEFTQTFHDAKTYRGYRLFAVDGTDIRIAHDPNNPETYCKNQNEKGFNLLHLNAMFDICNKYFVDALTQPRMLINENKALIDMVERSDIKGKVIVIADRGLECYNNFAHISEKDWNYLIRVKDVNSSGILSGLSLPTSEEFDITKQLILTRKHTKEVIDNPDIYKCLYNGAKFDFLENSDNEFYPISFRVVRFKITDYSYETVITNLDTFDFPPNELRELYNARWNIENSFRELKYAVALTSFHSKKQEYIIQEIFARIIMYNFAIMITSHIIISQAGKRHTYKVNFTVAIRVCKQFLRLRNSAPPTVVEAIIRKNISPVRPGRKYERIIRRQKEVSFLYRVA